ncbi:MAG: PD-(D/E)XK nuclease domain-containing protein, partial [Eubacteriales bacterium]|nr:PD-(D/E)XK nuclease domain-containing protein [Eubacteriales bacterium]
FADIVFLPRKNAGNRPAMIVELKWNQDADTAIEQIKRKQYVKALEEYQGNILLVGISYDKTTKEHACVIETIKI